MTSCSHLYRLHSIFAQMPKQAPFLVRPLVSVIAGQVLSVYVNPKLKENFKFVNESLKGKEWFVGDGITGADSTFSVH